MPLHPTFDDFPAIPQTVNPYNQVAQFLLDGLAQVAGIEEEIPQHSQNIEIDTWEDWVRIIAGFKDLAAWHCEAWAWAWRIQLGLYQSPFVAIAARGSGKSSTAEGIITAVGARGTRKHVLYVRSTQAQANASLANISNILENGPIRDYYPLMSDRLISQFGQSRGWNRTMLRTASGFTVVAFGLDSSLRGFKVDDYRPDLICHAVGTQIYDPDLARWGSVEHHPGLITLKRGPGVRVTVSGVPEPETVTPEHRYWARNVPNVTRYRGKGKYDPTPRWIEAKDLFTTDHLIGWPIDQEVIDPQPILNYKVIENEDGITLSLEESSVTPPEFSDPEWWWLFGLWWNCGDFVDGRLCVRFNQKKDQANAQRLLDLLTKYQIKADRHTTRQGTAEIPRHYYHILFDHPTLYRWLRTWTNVTDDYKTPPEWVEKLDHKYQKQLVLGYLNMPSYTGKEKKEIIRKGPVKDFYVLRRILSRLGITAVIAKYSFVKTGTNKEISGYYFSVRDGWDIETGAPMPKQSDALIADGYLWSRVIKAEPVLQATFAPIQTESHTYLTHFGLSHNCLDDIDDKHDSTYATDKKVETITKSILPAGSSDMTVLAIQNLIIEEGVFGRMVNGSADYLADRIMIGPVPAIENLAYRVINNIPEITEGKPTWSGQSLEVCRQQMILWGVRAFLAEAQHKTNITDGGTFNGLTYNHISEDDLPELERIVCWIDPAVSATSRSDCQAIQIDAIERVKDPKIRPRIFRLYSWEGVEKPSAMIKRALREGTTRHVEKIGVETNQGGDLWEDEYLTIAGEMLDAEEIEYIPEFDSAKASVATGGKEDRASRMLTDYTRNYIVHVYGTHGTLENALGRFPMVEPDDLTDAAFWAWKDLREKDKWRGKPRHGKVSKQRLFGGGAQRKPSRANYLRRLGLR